MSQLLDIAASTWPAPLCVLLGLALWRLRARRLLHELRPWWANPSKSMLVWCEEPRNYSAPTHEFFHAAWERLFEEPLPDRSEFDRYGDKEIEVWRRGNLLIFFTRKGEQIRRLPPRQP